MDKVTHGELFKHPRGSFYFSEMLHFTCFNLSQVFDVFRNYLWFVTFFLS